MSIFLDRLDSAPLEVEAFNPFFYQWLSALIDTLNESIREIEQGLNSVVFPPFTTAQINAMVTAGTVQNGQGFYCTDHSPPCVVLYINNALVQISTTSFP